MSAQYLDAALYNDLQAPLLSSGREGLLLAQRLTEATGANELRKRELERAREMDEFRERLRTTLTTINEMLRSKS